MGSLTRVLSNDEWAHAARMSQGGETWAATRGALRWLLASSLDREPQSIEFATGPSGKPRVTDADAIRFNVSHTEGLALIALCSDREVGIDVQRTAVEVDVERLAEQYLPPSEAAIVRVTAPEARRAAFFAAWTRHEARLKLRGQSLTEHPSDPVSGSLVLVRMLEMPAGFAAAVAAEGGHWTVARHDLAELA
jgi:4'-phosphopantetheinyl transferase